ncbi:hypothetical protein VZ95_13085 [Elstera litoralis]|uniref:Pseudouridine synthase RsuA/RluA-like domain-containing protein n=1 Tax=Elstera litoralis TaxID=552518 RepID=A0A0F3IRL3_9PROT|nr:hypothetical protein VZ95_13085 [Elstera litoralis]
MHRDGLVLVLNKPAGMPVHSVAGGKSLHLSQLLYAWQYGLKQPPLLAHRLDRDTSGCLILARHRQAMIRMTELFATRQVEKCYWAVLDGVPATESGTIDAPLVDMKRPGGVTVRLARPDDGDEALEAVTEWRVLAVQDRRTWIEFRPRTGRSHQLRVHAASVLGCPIVGDRLYGRHEAAGLHLHARSVSFAPRANKPPLEINAPVPDGLAEVLARFPYVPSPD